MFQGTKRRNALLAALALTAGGSVLLAGTTHAAAASKTITEDQPGDVDGTELLGGSTSGNELIIGTPGGGAHPTIGGSVSGASHDTSNVSGNKVTVRSISLGTATNPLYIIGADAAGAGNASGNTVTFAGGTMFGNIAAGASENGSASGNELRITGGTLNQSAPHTYDEGFFGGITSGTGAATNNRVWIEGGHVNGNIFGGWSTNATATGNKVTILGGTITDTVKGGQANGTGDAEHNEVALSGGTVQGEVKGAVSKTGNVHYNKVTISGGSTTSVLGGYAWNDGVGGNADHNEVLITGGTIGEDSDHSSVTGGYSDRGNASGNIVTITNVAGDVIPGKIYGGYTYSAQEASGNRVSLGAVTVRNDVYGGYGYGATTNDNIVSLAGTHVNGIVFGGSTTSGTGNTLEIRGAGTEITSFDGVQRLHFYMPGDLTTTSAPMLKVMDTDNYDLDDYEIGAGVFGDTSALAKGDTVTLMQVAGSLTSASESIENKTANMHSISMDYAFALHKEGTDKLTATVTKAGLGKRTKSFVETRAASSALVNGGADLLTDAGMAAAAASAAGAGGAFDSFAVQGGSAMRLHSGSYVDAKGWNLSVGFARERQMKNAALTFGPFIEYGRGTYDSYLDDGTHADGKMYYIGAGVMGKFRAQSGSYIEGSLHAGRAHNDYSSSFSGTPVSYDSSSAYYAAHVGVGHEYRLPGGDVIEGYAKYFYSHQNGASATLSSGTRYDFSAVNSHRVRLGTRYTHKDSANSEVYTGLAWEFEFGGKAEATYQGYSTPSPSLRGGSALLEVGYRFQPQNSRISYGVSLMGMQGKREGLAGGVQITWSF